MNSIQTFATTGLMLLIASAATHAQSNQGQSDLEWDAPGAINGRSSTILIKDQVDVTVQIPGKLIELKPGYLGGRVKKGDLVLALDARTVTAELAELKLQAESTVLVNYAKSKLQVAEKKLKNKNAKNADSLKKFDETLYTTEEIELLELEVLEAKAEVAKSEQDKEAAMLKYQTKQTEVEQYTVHAPIDGVVTDLHLKANGSGVRQGDPVMTIVNLAEVTARFQVPEEFEALVTVGDKVVVRRSGGSQQPDSSGLPDAFKKTSAPQAPAAHTATDNVLFQGEIVFIVPSKEGSGHLKVEAVIKNKFVNGKYLLRENSGIKAQVIPAARR